MAEWYVVEPEVAGELGDDTVMNTATRPPQVRELHFVFNDWLGSQLITCFPVFLATLDLIDAVDAAELTGVTPSTAEIEFSDEAHAALDVEQMPEFRWLHVTGSTGEDDFAIDADGHLIVSADALAVIEPMLIDADIRPLDTADVS